MLKPNRTSDLYKAASPMAKWIFSLLFLGAGIGIVAGCYFFYNQETAILWEIVILIGLAFLAAGLVCGVLFYFHQKNLFEELCLTELQLAETREWFRTTLYSIGDGVIATDINGSIRQMNHVAETLTGWIEKEAFGRPLGEVFQTISEDSRQKAQDPVARVMTNGRIAGSANHTLLVSKEGIERPIADSGAPILNQKGEIVGVVLIFRDETEERQLEKDLRENQALLQSLMNNSSAMIYLIDSNKRILMVNQKVASFANCTVEKIIGRTRSDFIPKRIAQRLDAWDMEIFEGKPLKPEELNFEDADGKHTYLLSHFPVLDAKGDIIAVGGISTDITEYREMETALKANEARYQALVESAADHLYMLDPEGVFISSNDRLTNFGIILDGRIVGKKIEAIYPAEPAGKFHEKFNQVIAGKTPVRFEHTVNNSAGREIIIENTLYPIQKDGVVWAVGGIGRDITEYKQLEAQFRQAQKMQAVGQLAGGVAHDFNNMLGIITGYAEICLENMAPSDPLYEDLNEILFAARRSKEITSQLLAFARRQTISPKIIDLNAMISRSERMLKRLIGEDIELKFFAGKEIWPVKIDPVQVHQILANLAVNARDAINGVGTVTVKTTCVALDEDYCREHIGFKPGEFVMLSVGDTGTGIDKSIAHKIFDPFFTTKTEGKGTGLGLATVYGIVKQNLGYINVESRIGMGATFKIFLPRVEGPYDELSFDEIKDQITGNETILVVEDEIQILRLCKRTLEPLGYKVITAQTPGDAVLISENVNETIDLLITDVVMPKMNGKELAERIKSARPEIRALYMSGYTADVIVDRGVLLEGVNFIQKPFSSNQLASKVKKVLNQ